MKHIFVGMAKPVAAYPGSSVIAIGCDPNKNPIPTTPRRPGVWLKRGMGKL